MAFLFLRQNKKDLHIEKEALNAKFALLYLNLTLAYLSLNLALGQDWSKCWRLYLHTVTLFDLNLLLTCALHEPHTYMAASSSLQWHFGTVWACCYL